MSTTRLVLWLAAFGATLSMSQGARSQLTLPTPTEQTRVAPLWPDSPHATSPDASRLLGALSSRGLNVVVDAYPPGTEALLERDLARLLARVERTDTEFDRKVARNERLASDPPFPLDVRYQPSGRSSLPLFLVPDPNDLRPLLAAWYADPPDDVYFFGEVSYARGRTMRTAYTMLLDPIRVERVSLLDIPTPIGASLPKSGTPDVEATTYDRLVGVTLASINMNRYEQGHPLASQDQRVRGSVSVRAVTPSLYLYQNSDGTRAPSGRGFETWSIAFPIADANGAAVADATTPFRRPVSTEGGPSAPVLPVAGPERAAPGQLHECVALTERMLDESPVWGLFEADGSTPWRENWLLIAGTDALDRGSLVLVCLSAASTDEQIDAVLEALASD